MDDEVDVEELHRFVDKALSQATSTSRSAPGLLSYGDVQSFKLLADALGEHMHQGDVQVLLDRLRDSLSTGLSSPDVGQLHSVVSKCRKCPSATTTPQLPLGNVVEPDIALVADTFPLAAMDLLMTELKEAGFSSNRVGLTATTRCENGVASTCAPYLYHELSAWRPKLIVPLGAPASKVVLNTEDFNSEHERGSLHWIGPWAILPTHAPGYVLRSEVRTKELRADLKQAYDFCYGSRYYE